MFKVNNRNTRKCEICSKLTLKKTTTSMICSYLSKTISLTCRKAHLNGGLEVLPNFLYKRNFRLQLLKNILFMAIFSEQTQTISLVNDLSYQLWSIWNNLLDAIELALKLTFVSISDFNIRYSICIFCINYTKGVRGFAF